MQAVAYPHIEIRADGQPVIAGANTKVTMIAMDRLMYNWDADEIRRQRPHLTLGEIYSALAYYYDHEDELNRLIERERAEAQELCEKLSDPAARTKLQEAKKARWG
jgi:uncharacterized protein (DUF433 family)